LAAEVERLAGPQQAQGYLRLRDWLTRLYQVEFDGFIASNFDSPLSLLTPQLARLAALGAFRRWDRVVKRFITDDRLRRIFTFQALYAGVPPQRALAVYAVIAYMDTIAGVYFPRGGMRALPDALAAAASDAGVEFRYGAKVSGLDLRSGRVRAVDTDRGERINADAVVLTTELPDTYRLLGRTPRRLLPLRPSPSAVVAHVGCRSPHHHIVFGKAWEQTFRDIIDDGVVMRDPSLLVTRPTAGDPGLAPAGRDLLYVLAPAPNLLRGNVDWDTVGGSYTDSMIAAVTDRLPELGEDAELLHVVNPADWARQGMVQGTPFALAHTFGQTGVPPALLSGRLAADRITGAATRRVATHIGSGA
jgi:phytoene desaturase